MLDKMVDGEVDDITIAEGMVQKICKLMPKNSVILELGSGKSSSILSDNGFKVWSVEHDIDWLNLDERVKYIHAPIVRHKVVRGFDHNKWYDKEVIKTIPFNYSLIIVDGPPANYGRSGFIKYLDLFDTKVPIIFDDVNRSIDLKIAIKVSGRLKRSLVIHDTWKPKHWGLIDYAP